MRHCRHWRWWLTGADAVGRPVGWFLTLAVNLGWLPIWGVVELYLLLVSGLVLSVRAARGRPVGQLRVVPVGLGWFVLDG